MCHGQHTVSCKDYLKWALDVVKRGYRGGKGTMQGSMAKSKMKSKQNPYEYRVVCTDASRFHWLDGTFEERSSDKHKPGTYLHITGHCIVFRPMYPGRWSCKNYNIYWWSRANWSHALSTTIEKREARMISVLFLKGADTVSQSVQASCYCVMNATVNRKSTWSSLIFLDVVELGLCSSLYMRVDLMKKIKLELKKKRFTFICSFSSRSCGCEHTALVIPEPGFIIGFIIKLYYIF